jgi:predicted metal-dependent hydrolase
MLNNWLRSRRPTRSTEITADGVVIEVLRKRIKNFYLRVDRRAGRVRLSAPSNASDDEVASVVEKRLDWIKRHQAQAAAAPPIFRPRFLSGETHLYLGVPLRLEVVERTGRGSRVVYSGSTLQLQVRRRSRIDERQRAIHDWYRDRLGELVPPLVARWQPVMGVAVAEWRVKRMRTRWGTCNIRARRIWLSLELAKYPVECLEYVVVHEMVHLLERNHNARFKSLMDKFLPDWRERQRTLGRGLAGHYKQGDGNDDEIDLCD